MPRPVEAIIHADALVHNLRRARCAAPEAKVWAVVKANAYGHGIERVCESFAAADGIALLDLNEAERIRGLEAPGLLGSQAVKWNFTKFLIGRDGRVIKRYAPSEAPQALRADIEAALAA